MTLREQVQRDEGGYQPRPYRDSQGLWTVGFGWCLERRPLSLRAAEFILDEQLQETTASTLAEWPWVAQLDEPRRAVLIGMAYNLGVAGLKGFKKLLAAAQAGDWAQAAAHGLDSKWRKQVGPRAERHIN